MPRSIIERSRAIHFLFRLAHVVPGLVIALSISSACDGTIFGGESDTQINAPKHCGNGVCSANEDCNSCPDDCGVCANDCGDGACSADENCSSCEADCGTCSSRYYVSDATTRYGTASGSFGNTFVQDGTSHEITEVKIGPDYRLQQDYRIAGLPAVTGARLTIVARLIGDEDSLTILIKMDDDWTEIGSLTASSDWMTLEYVIDLQADDAEDNLDLELRFADSTTRDRDVADKLSIDHVAVTIGADATCGDGTCEASESCSSCQDDCGACPTCGDGACSPGEDCTSCETDCGACPPSCGDGTCDMTESCTSCEVDCEACPPTCGDGTCDAAETCGSCAADCGVCPAVCGDGACSLGEDCSNCASDCGACPPSCGDGTCDAVESCSSCAADCGVCPPVCGDGVCEGNENCSSCASDCGACPPVCGDGTCDITEDCGSCASDCGSCGPTCDLPVSTVPDGKHNEGRACRGCHTGSPAVNFPIAGTLYDTVTGTNTVSGATITAVDANGRVIKMVTADNGNFWTTSTNIAWPVQVRASSCPSVAEMISPVTATGGDCNSCHNSSFRIYLP